MRLLSTHAVVINKSEQPRPRLVLDTPPYPIVLYRSYCTSTQDAARYFAGCACVARIWAAAVRVLGECGFEPVTLGYSLLLISLLPTRRTSVPETFVLYLSPGNVVLWWLHVDSKENMTKLAILYVILSSYANSIVYLWRLQKSPKFAILVRWKSKICDFLDNYNCNW